MVPTTLVSEIGRRIGVNVGRPAAPALHVLVGAPGAGKSTLCKALEKQGITVLSLDGARGVLGRHSGDQAATPGAIALVVEQMIAALRKGEPVALDATSSTANERAVWLGIARAQGVPAIAVVVRTELDACLSRNARRPEHRRVPTEAIDAMWTAITAVSDEALHREGFTAVHNVRGGSWLSTGEAECRARRGDLVVIATTRRSTRVRDFFVGEGNTEYEIAEVTSVSRDGQVKEVRTVSLEAPVPLSRWHGLTQIWIVPRDRVDTAAVLAAARAHTWPGQPKQPKAFDTLGAVQDVMRANRKERATGGILSVPAPVQATSRSAVDKETS